MMKDKDFIGKIIGIVGIFLIILGAILIFSTSFFDTDVDFHTYEFEVESKPREGVRFEDFQIFYDFSKYEGKISFELFNTSVVNYMVFRLPKELNVTNMVWNDREINYTKDVDYREDIKYNPGPNTHLIYVIENLKEKTLRTNIEIDLKGTIYPNSEIIFMPMEVERVIPPFGKERAALFKFFIDDDEYLCKHGSLCQESFHENLDFHRQENNLLASTKRSENLWNDADFSIFYLNYNKKSNEMSVQLSSVGWGLLLLGLLPSIEFLLSIFLNKKKD